jgi:hypothetical protein
MQSIEISDAIDSQDDRLAIDDELLAPVPQGRLGDPREPFGPVMAAAGDQPHAVAVTFYAEAVPVVLDLMEPVGAGGHGFGGGGNAELVLGHQR